jgi:hypothetical protein
MVELAGDLTVLDEYHGRKQIQKETVALLLSADLAKTHNQTKNRRVHINLEPWMVELLGVMCTRVTKRDLVLHIVREHIKEV